MYQNMREAAHKRLAAPSELTEKGKLTRVAREKMQQEIRRAWTAMDEGERKQYKELYQARLDERKNEKRRATASPPESAGQTSAVRCSHWALGTMDSTIDPALAQRYFAAGGKMPPVSEVFDPDEFRVRPSAEPVGPLLGDGIVIQGCPLHGKNLCRQDPDRRRMDAIGSALSKIVRSVGKAAAKSGDLLIMCESSAKATGDSQRARHFFLLNAPVFKPVYQDLTWCKPSGHDVRSSGLAFPFEVEIDVAP